MYYPSVQRMMLNKGLSEAEINSYIQICAMIGKFGIAGSFALIYNYTAELYPAVVRYDQKYIFQNIQPTHNPTVKNQTIFFGNNFQIVDYTV